MSLSDILAHDAGMRKVGIAETTGLISIERLVPRSWNYEAPTITRERGHTFKERVLTNGVDTFAKQFFKRYPALEGVPLDDLLIAGSSVAQFIVAGTYWKASDVDVFVCGGLSSADATARALRFARDLVENLHLRARKKKRAALVKLASALAETDTNGWSPDARRGLGDLIVQVKAHVANGLHYAWVQNARRYRLVGYDALVAAAPGGIATKHADAFRDIAEYRSADIATTRSPGSISIIIDGVKIQVILRTYASPSEVLHGFDLGSCAVGFDGTGVWCTRLAQFAYETGNNIVDTTRRSTTYEARLRKYFGRGFDIIMPGLDIAKLSRKNLAFGYAEIADLPRFPFAYEKIKGNRVFVDKLLWTEGPQVDYDEDDETFSDLHMLAYVNLRRLLEGKTQLLHADPKNGGPMVSAATDIFRKPPHLSLKMLTGVYDRIRSACFDGAKMNLRSIKRFVPSVDLVKIVEAYSPPTAAKDVTPRWTARTKML